MAKVEVHYTDYLKETLGPLGEEGLLLCTMGQDGRPNVMTIGWGTVGIIWGKPIFAALVRPSRLTYACLEGCKDFTVNVLPREMAEVATFCGTVSGRTHDKFAERGLTSVPSRHVSSPLIDQSILQYECRVVHYNDVVETALAPDIISSCYKTGDFHRLYFGEILAVYAEPDVRERVSGPANR
jgi:flavin reductase (DIM6/NTAB) family NADH-FMN oxidoreductase RutF